MKLRTAGLIVAVVAGLMIAMLIFMISEDDGRKPVFVTPTATKSPVKGMPGIACKVGKDAGCGTPNASCASNRVGLSFTKNGITYTCKGPKPYRWRR